MNLKTKRTVIKFTYECENIHELIALKSDTSKYTVPKYISHDIKEPKKAIHYYNHPKWILMQFTYKYELGCISGMYAGSNTLTRNLCKGEKVHVNLLILTSPNATML